IQQALHLAKELNKGEVREFKYKDKGSMATVGRNLAVADLPHMHLSGFFAWLTWMFIHLISILGMRNKITVLITWIWAYCSYPTSLRLIMSPSRYPLKSDRKDGLV
ncbi:MAG: NAD(P)/FAD-dependent oxidoreductase, partial [Paramuribaculum sp.]|nr:NAD(P)/FAD-dependent oxidoreductase [Paramuribaculum sp.]